jgi:hypothetical protein
VPADHQPFVVLCDGRARSSVGIGDAIRGPRLGNVSGIPLTIPRSCLAYPPRFMIDLLARWNRWGTGTLASGHARDLVTRLVPFLTTKDVIGLVGPRRAGKSTVLYQLMDALSARGVVAEQMLHVNFEDPAFAPELGTDLLDRVDTAFRDEAVDPRSATAITSRCRRS